jgi:transposase
MRAHSYPSDVTDEQWALIEPHLPVYPGGRPRTTDLRDVVDAVFYVLRTGCQWRYLPKDFPPKSTVWRYFDEWRHNGTLDALHDTLRQKVRTQEKPYAPRTTASVDSQSVDTTSGGEQRGRDNAKNVDGRKRHIVVDSLGLLMAVAVTSAALDDGKAAPRVLQKLRAADYPRLRVLLGDNKYRSHALSRWMKVKQVSYQLQIRNRPEGVKGFKPIKLRWKVERTFAWLGKCRRLSKDRERSVLSSEAFIKLAMIHLMLNRLEPKDTDAEFRYRPAA